MRVTFWGAAGTVTGSRTHVVHQGESFLVDGGLFQGYKHLRLKNWAPPPFDISSLKGIFLTHAHIDHSGWLPLLVQKGYQGPIWATPLTCRLAQILLPDSARLSAEDAEIANASGASSHHPALPLYTLEDVRNTLALMVPVAFDQKMPIPGGGSAFFGRAGHIPGAAWLHITEADGRRTLFSGDLGRPYDPLMFPPDAPPPADTLILESTYGGHTHPQTHVGDELLQVAERTFARGGTVLIPVFAVGRAQEILWQIWNLKKKGHLSGVRVVLDSPMAESATDIFLESCGEHRVSESICHELRKMVDTIGTQEESFALGRHLGDRPTLLLSASGMATGGRVLHHLKNLLPHPKHTVLFVGYQAGGTRGHDLLQGAKKIKIHGEHIWVHAEVRLLEGLSAHADESELLMWASRMTPSPSKVLLNHGELDSLESLRKRIAQDLHWDAQVVESGVVYEV